MFPCNDLSVFKYTVPCIKMDTTRPRDRNQLSTTLGQFLTLFTPIAAKNHPPLFYESLFWYFIDQVVCCIPGLNNYKSQSEL